MTSSQYRVGVQDFPSRSRWKTIYRLPNPIDKLWKICPSSTHSWVRLLNHVCVLQTYLTFLCSATTNETLTGGADIPTAMKHYCPGLTTADINALVAVGFNRNR